MSVSSVLDRYSAGAKEREEALCCPVDYDTELLRILPTEIIERDYGCGDPSRYVKPGDTVLDLGSGGGKICYMAAQLVGDEGQVIGVDMNDDMLGLARQYQNDMANKLGSQRVSFRKGQIQDLALDMEVVEQHLHDYPINNANDLLAFKAWQEHERRERPMIADNSIDLIVSNCVLNLVGEADRNQLISEIHRVLKPGGRVAISDIVADEHVPTHLKQDAKLWSGCISGAFQELDFLKAFANNGFRAVAYDKWDAQPWQVVEGIEFRSVTLTAVKADPRDCIDRGHAVIYKGPFSSVWDDEGHEYRRGERMAVCERSYELLTQGAYADDFIGITPVQLKEPTAWCAPSGTTRPAAETKGADHGNKHSEPSGGCC
ncbi:MAG: methyltransferase domain-containing protein [Nevskiales bacterium]